MGILDSSGTTVASYTYNAWGKLLSSSGDLASINPLRYRGYYYDAELEMYYLKSRYYDPEICRFISSDEFVNTGLGFVGYNMFAYCLNNPINMIDCFGQWPQWIEDTADSISTALANFFNELAGTVDSFFNNIFMYEPHHKKGSTNPSNRNKHEDGEARKNRDQGNEKGDRRRKDRSNKRHNTLSPDLQQDSKLMGGVLVFVSIVGIAYLTFNDATVIGVADDVAIVPTLETLRRGVAMIFA